MAVVETRHVTKIFKEGELGAVNDVSLQTNEGEFLVLLGPSGSGKTTLLRMIAGLEAPTAGQIFIGGRDVTRQTPRERRIAMVFQSYALYPHLSVYENIAFPLKAQKVPKEQHRTKVEWAAGLLGIGHLLKRKPRELSGGERQRVALARAMVRNPTVFLLDEPLSNLDAKLRAAAREEIESFQKRVGTTTIYVTHDQVEAMAMGDRIVVLNKGVVHQIGTPKEVYEEPADTFVATFLGSPPMNLLENDGAIVGFRPEHFRPAVVARGGERIHFKFRLKLIEFLGSEWILYGALEGGRFNGQSIISRLPATISAEAPREPDKIYDFAVAEHDLKFFDRQTEQRAQPRSLTWQ
ncbi:MAG: ABC transporter ATP-binding protein [Terriglobales bacterium]